MFLFFHIFDSLPNELAACSMELMTKHPTGAVCGNPATARCRVAAHDVLTSALTGMFHSK